LHIIAPSILKVIIYTDGAARGNPGKGGYGAVLMFGQHRKELSGGYRLTTNNRMELMALKVALEALTKDGLTIDVYTDSKYVMDAFEKNWVYGWQKKGFKNIKNPDLWRPIIMLYNKHVIKFHWVKGHAGNPMNERCDVLATEAADGGGLLVDIGYEDSIKEDKGWI
jgi:ribonuclease HI